jgi:hypothetical protein
VEPTDGLASGYIYDWNVEGGRQQLHQARRSARSISNASKVRILKHLACINFVVLAGAKLKLCKGERHKAHAARVLPFV